MRGVFTQRWFCLVLSSHPLSAVLGRAGDRLPPGGGILQQGNPGEPPSDLCHSSGHSETSEAHGREHTLPVFIVSTHSLPIPRLAREGRSLCPNVPSALQGKRHCLFLELGVKKRALVFETSAMGLWQE